METKDHIIVTREGWEKLADWNMLGYVSLKKGEGDAMSVIIEIPFCTTKNAEACFDEISLGFM